MKRLRAKRCVSQLVLLLFLLSSFHSAQAQLADEYSPGVTRIIFLLDGSGSMKEAMDGSTKFELSKKIIADYLDSLARANPKVEIAVRVFGHQSQHSEKNCTDSKLEIPFGRHTAASVKLRLDAITPLGWTPIAYALEQAAKDFPEDPNAKNAIVIITDGLETCGGDPCAVAEIFQQRRIALKPFVIGLGLPEESQKYFDCVGKYFNVITEISFDSAMSTVITQALNPTTAQINLLTEFGNPTETNIEISLHDGYSGVLLYNFVHTIDEKGVPDTLKLNPAGKYNIIVHSYPPVLKKAVELVAGTHNIIAIELPQGTLKLTEGTLYKRETPLQCIIREKGGKNILMIQDFNSTRRYLTGLYDLEILTLPRIRMRDVDIRQSATKEVTVESPGILNVFTTAGGIASVYVENANGIERIFEFKNLGPKETLLLQPGKYTLVFRLDDKKNSAFTRTEKIEIASGQVTAVRL